MDFIKQKIVFPLRYHKNMVLLTLLIGVITVSGIAYCAVTQAQIDAAGGLASVVFGWVDEIFGVDGLDEAKSLLNITFQNGTIRAGGYTFTKLGGLITKAGKVFRNAGVFLLFVYFGINIMESFSVQSQMFAESLVRKFVFLIAGIVLMNYAMDLTFGIANIFTAMSERMLSSSSLDQSVSSQIFALKQSMYSDMGLDTTSDVPVVGGIIDALKPFTAPLKYVIEMLIPYLLAKLAGVVVSVVCWTRFVQIVLMSIVSPLSLCDMGDHILQSNAMKAVRNIGSIALAGPMILLSLFICREIQLQIMTTATTSMTAASYTGAIWSMAVLAIVQISLVTKSTSLAKQALGMA